MKAWEKSHRWNTIFLQSGVEHFRLAATSVVNIHPTFHFEVAQYMKKAGSSFKMKELLSNESHSCLIIHLKQQVF
jgi:hypothetical protein